MKLALRRQILDIATRYGLKGPGGDAAGP